MIGTIKSFSWRYGPGLLGVLSIIFILWDFKNGFIYLPREREVYTNLYAAVFDWSAIQTGFLFAAFGYLAGGTSRFVKFLDQTSLVATIMGYVRRATVLGFVLTFISLPLLVFGPTITTSPKWLVVVISVWFGLFIWSLLAFLRVAYVFGLIAQRAGRPSDEGE